jgi:hypothetical protein
MTMKMNWFEIKFEIASQLVRLAVWVCHEAVDPYWGYTEEDDEDFVDGWDCNELQAMVDEAIVKALWKPVIERVPEIRPDCDCSMCDNEYT